MGLSYRWPVSYCKELCAYSLPFLGSDMSVVRRTQRYLHENLEESPVSKYAYLLIQRILCLLQFPCEFNKTRKN
jgi:hypothetical protein